MPFRGDWKRKCLPVYSDVNAFRPTMPVKSVFQGADPILAQPQVQVG